MEETAPVDAPKQPVCFLVIGMAGSGKTTLVQRLVSHMGMKKIPRYVINLDPAVHEVPYPCNVDIRSSIDYKEVMKQYGLGPNGAIVTALNLFATQFDTVAEFCVNKQSELDYLLVDTPGQIEVFTWSASGTIITEALALSFPTCVLYVLDTTRVSSPATFMSNMLYACSILYKTRLPFVMAFNKCDAASPAMPMEWMKDFDALDSALSSDGGYMSNLTRSMSLVLQTFYEQLTAVSCSALTGENIDAVLEAIENTRGEYETEYLAPLKEKIRRRAAEQEAEMGRVRKDIGEEHDEEDDGEAWDDEQ